MRRKHKPYLVRSLFFLLLSIIGAAIFIEFDMIYMDYIYLFNMRVPAEHIVVGIATALLFLTVFHFYLYLSGETVFELDLLGIVDESRPLSFGYLFWDDILKVYSKKVGGDNFIELQMKDPEEYWRYLSTKEQKKAIKRMEAGHELVAISLNGTKYTPQAVLQVMKTVAESSRNSEDVWAQL